MVGLRGYYINLDRSVDRRAAMEARIAAAGLGQRYRRFAAVDGAALGALGRLNASEHGCYRSHLDLIEQHVGSGDVLHVVEDDVMFSARTGPELQRMVFSQSFGEADLVYLSVIVAPDPETVRRLKLAMETFRSTGKLAFVDLRGFPFSGMSSYLVNPRSAAKVASSLRAGLAAGTPLPSDLHLREEIHAGRLRAVCLFPFLTSVDMSTSTIQGDSPSIRVTLELSASFFVDADHAAGLQRVAAIVRDDPPDVHLDLLAAVERFRMSHRWQPF